MAKDVKEVSTTKKVYLTPGEFIWDNYKRGQRMIEEEKEQQLSMIKALEKTFNPEEEEVKFTKRQVKTILKNFNNTAKAIRNINRVLKEVL